MLGKRSKAGKQGRQRALRVFFATDVHGSDRCFRKFLAAADVYDADVLLLGGDVAGKGLVPIVERGATVTAEVRGELVTVPAGDEEQLRREINIVGCYPRRMPEETVGRLREDPGYLDQLFREEIVNQIARWCDLVAERVRPEVRCIITPGNDDPRDIDRVLESASRVECPERELCDLGPVLLASLGDVTPTPWHTEREYEEPVLAERIEAILDQAPQGRPTMLNFHCPPYGIGLDVATELDDTLRPVLRGGQPSLVPVGSKAVRDAIQKYQPTVALHGHIHESPGAQRIGASLCINPGSDYGADILRGAIVDLADDGTCLDYLLTTG